MCLGKKIKKLRNQLGLPQTEFAKLLGLNQIRVSQFERGYCYPRYEVLKKMHALIKKNKLNIDLLD